MASGVTVVLGLLIVGSLTVTSLVTSIISLSETKNSNNTFLSYPVADNIFKIKNATQANRTLNFDLGTIVNSPSTFEVIGRANSTLKITFPSPAVPTPTGFADEVIYSNLFQVIYGKVITDSILSVVESSRLPGRPVPTLGIPNVDNGTISLSLGSNSTVNSGTIIADSGSNLGVITKITVDLVLNHVYTAPPSCVVSAAAELKNLIFTRCSADFNLSTNSVTFVVSFTGAVDDFTTPKNLFNYILL